MPASPALMLWIVKAAACLAAAPSAPGRRAGIEWVRIEGGTFMMGNAEQLQAQTGMPHSGNDNERPVHEVTVADFEIARTLVTFKQYEACVRAGACTPAHADDGQCRADEHHRGPRKLAEVFRGPNHPVVCVTREQARTFARWAGGRLPSEAEWEFAARSRGKVRAYPWGDEPPTCERAVMKDLYAGCNRHATWPVCSRPRGNTEQGLCDMTGEVWEWMEDDYHPTYDGAPADGRPWKGSTPAGGTLRGCPYYFASNFLRLSYRDHYGGGTDAGDSMGFRPVRSVK